MNLILDIDLCPSRRYTALHLTIFIQIRYNNVLIVASPKTDIFFRQTIMHNGLASEIM